MRVDYAVRQHEEWYKGDGLYGDGPQFHWDYYNSFVIQPMLLAVIETVSKQSKAWDSFHPAIVTRAQRYAAIQERFIAPDASFPAIGRSLAYRFGAFHLLATMALRRQLPDGVSPAQVRACAHGRHSSHDRSARNVRRAWLADRRLLRSSAVGCARRYISTGSLYLCSAALLPLGLPAADPFWSGPAQPWTARKIWSGQNVPIDHAI